jgi:hypothetical protein
MSRVAAPTSYADAGVASTSAAAIVARAMLRFRATSL